MKFRKKPVEVEAVQFQGGVSSGNHIIGWMSAGTSYPARWEDGNLLIKTLEGIMRAFPGDWIIRGVKGEYYPCKPDIFESTYEQIEPWPMIDQPPKNQTPRGRD